MHDRRTGQAERKLIPKNESQWNRHVVFEQKPEKFLLLLFLPFHLLLKAFGMGGPKHGCEDKAFGECLESAHNAKGESSFEKGSGFLEKRSGYFFGILEPEYPGRTAIKRVESGDVEFDSIELADYFLMDKPRYFLSYAHDVFSGC